VPQNRKPFLVLMTMQVVLHAPLRVFFLVWFLYADLPNPNRVFNFKAEFAEEKTKWMEALVAAGAEPAPAGSKP
jgi:hypothetical protein